MSKCKNIVYRSTRARRSRAATRRFRCRGCGRVLQSVSRCYDHVVDSRLLNAILLDSRHQSVAAQNKHGATTPVDPTRPIWLFDVRHVELAKKWRCPITSLFR